MGSPRFVWKENALVVKLAVVINGFCVYEESISHLQANKYAEVVRERYQVELLQQCGVDAHLQFTEVQSLMNAVDFEPKAEHYDYLYFENRES